MCVQILRYSIFFEPRRIFSACGWRTLKARWVFMAGIFRRPLKILSKNAQAYDPSNLEIPHFSAPRQTCFLDCLLRGERSALEFLKNIQSPVDGDFPSCVRR